MVSRSHLDAPTQAYLDGLPHTRRIACGSSVKFCRLAEGAADHYPRLGPTRDWDVAAGHAVLTAAGGSVLAPDGSPLRYGTAGAAHSRLPRLGRSGAEGSALRSRTKRAQHVRPFALGRAGDAFGVGRKGREPIAVVEQKQPPAGYRQRLGFPATATPWATPSGS